MAITISHRPFGSGHPYAYSTDQRVPVRPVEGEGLWLGAVTNEDVSSLRCEFEVDALVTVLQARRQSESSSAEGVGPTSGHLAAAQASALASDGKPWSVRIDSIHGSVCRYRFIAVEDDGTETATEWFSFTTSRWVEASKKLVVAREGKGVDPSPDKVEELTDGERSYRLRFVLPLESDEHVVGFGERYDAVDQRGLTPDSVVFEQYKGQGKAHRTYFPMPFAHVVGGSGWGFYVRTSRRVWFDVAASTASELWVELEVGADGSAELDLFAGTPTEVLSGFLDKAGRAKELPSWIYKLWASSNEWNTQSTVTQQIELHRKYDIPVGTVVIEAWSDEEEITIFRDAQYEIDHQGNPRVGSDFTYSREGAWPDPAAMVEQLHNQNIKVILWQIPLLKSLETFAEEKQDHGEQVIIDGRRLVADGVAVRESDGSAYHNRAWWFPKALMPDLSTEKGRKWWSDRRRYLVEDLGVDGFKTDGGEHAWGEELRYNDGTRGDNGNNLNPVRYAKTYCEMMEECGKDPITFSRSGFVGSQRYGIFWAGDEDSTWEAFRSSIRAGITAAACGVVYWGWDLAGFSGAVPSPELYLRAAAAAAFMPIMQYHSEFNHHELPLRDRTPWNIAEQSGDSAVIDDFREVVKLRERLVPYLERQAHKTIASDTPLMRSLLFDYPNDKHIWENSLEYMLGDSLLVNPVTAPGATTWATYLPKGIWVDVWTGESLTGDRKVTSEVTRRNYVPVFCKVQDWDSLEPIFTQKESSESQ